MHNPGRGIVAEANSPLRKPQQCPRADSVSLAARLDSHSAKPNRRRPRADRSHEIEITNSLIPAAQFSLRAAVADVAPPPPVAPVPARRESLRFLASCGTAKDAPRLRRRADLRLTHCGVPSDKHCANASSAGSDLLTDHEFGARWPANRPVGRINCAVRLEYIPLIKMVNRSGAVDWKAPAVELACVMR